MRIISGTCKGRHLASLKGSQTRPTQDSVREAIFNIIGPEGPFLRILDLFAGTGALGLEALSRWGGEAVFIETSTLALNCLRENIRRLNLEGRSQVIKRDLSQGLFFLRKLSGPFDLIFMDPPYGQGWCMGIIPKLLSFGLLNETGMLVLEHDLQEPVPLEVGPWRIEDQRKYGQTRLSFYQQKQR